MLPASVFALFEVGRFAGARPRGAAAAPATPSADSAPHANTLATRMCRLMRMSLLLVFSPDVGLFEAKLRSESDADHRVVDTRMSSPGHA